jgi:hypothetical protein
MEPDSSVGVATRHGLEGRGSILGEGKHYVLHANIVFYPMGTGVKTTAASGWSLYSIYFRGREWWSCGSTLTYTFVA